MFPKFNPNPVLIGEPYKTKEKFTLFDSKIGGVPLWFTEIPSDYPYHCKSCNHEMCLLLQVYVPDDECDRILYIFTCKNSECQIKSEGWMCILQQKEIPEEDLVEEKPKPKPVETKPVQKNTLSWDFGPANNTNSFSFGSSSSSKSSQSSLFGGSSLAGNADLMQLLAQMENKNKRPSVESKPIEETPPEVEYAHIPEGLVANYKVDCLEEYFLDVFEEPRVEKPEKKQKESVVVESEGGSGEAYDDDKSMSKLIKFNAVLKRNPSQVIRIAMPDGMPLYPITNRMNHTPVCSCGGKLVFNLQILPTLLSFLPMDADDSIQSLVKSKEWSSVLVYTCEHNCSKGTVIVLPPF